MMGVFIWESANAVGANAPWIMEYVTEEFSNKGTGSNMIKFILCLVSPPLINRQAICLVVKMMDSGARMPEFDSCLYQCQVP